MAHWPTALQAALVSQASTSILRGARLYPRHHACTRTGRLCHHARRTLVVDGQFTRDNAERRDPWLVPVTWIDGWPVIGINIKDMNGETPIQMKKPIQGFKRMLPQGSDNFSSSELNPRWQWNHVPHEGAWSLTDRKGWLRLKAYKRQGKRKDFFGASGTLFQHYMHGDSVVITIRMDISHIAEGGRTGLAIFNGGKSYANFGVSNGRVFYEENGKKRRGLDAQR